MSVTGRVRGQPRSNDHLCARELPLRDHAFVTQMKTTALSVYVDLKTKLWRAHGHFSVLFSIGKAATSIEIRSKLWTRFVYCGLL